MKKIINLLLVMLFAVGMSSCNVFDPIDPDLNKLDRCQSYNDAGNYDAAIEACDAVIADDPTNISAQLELADACLGSLGINIQTLSNIFIQKSGQTITLTSFADSILKKASISKVNGKVSRQRAQIAVDAMDSYGALLTAGGSPTLEQKQVATFYSLLARVCQVSVLLAYAHIDAGSTGTAVLKADICDPTVVGCDGNPLTPICLSNCGGMSDADAGTALDTMVKLVDYIKRPAADGGLPTGIDVGNVSTVLDVPFISDGLGYNIFTDAALLPSAIKSGAGRRLLLEMAN